MAFVAPTGLTLAFISGLFRFCSLRSLPFFPVYAWVGIWTSAFMILLGSSGSSKLIRFCTRFTDEVFNGMLSVNFLYEALSSLRRNFVNADPMNLTMPFVALSMALGTFFGTMNVIKFETTKFFNSKVRKIIKNFGPVSMILLFTLLNLLPWTQKFNVPTLTVPDHFQLAGGRSFMVALKSIPVNLRLLCALPATLLTCLFFMDQNISVRLVNSPDNKLKKGAAYNLDMVALGIITGGKTWFVCVHIIVTLSVLILIYMNINCSSIYSWTALDVRGNCAINESCPGHGGNEAESADESDGNHRSDRDEAHWFCDSCHVSFHNPSPAGAKENSHSCGVWGILVLGEETDDREHFLQARNRCIRRKGPPFSNESNPCTGSKENEYLYGRAGTVLTWIVWFQANTSYYNLLSSND